MGPTQRNTASSRLIRAGNLNPVDFAPFGQVIQNPSTHNDQPGLSKAVANQGSATKWLNVTSMTNFYGMARSQKAAKVDMNMFVCKPRELRDLGGGKKLFDVKILERHPFTPQTFIPLGVGKEEQTYYLVIVAPTLPNRSWEERASRLPPYPTPEPRRRRSLRERLLGARPNPFTNDFSSSTTPSDTLDGKATKPKGPGPPDLDNIRAFIARGDQAVTYGPGTWHAPMVALGERPIEFVVVQHANGVAEEDCQETTSGMEEGSLAIDLTDGAEMEATLKAKL